MNYIILGWILLVAGMALVTLIIFITLKKQGPDIEKDRLKKLKGKSATILFHKKVN